MVNKSEAHVLKYFKFGLEFEMFTLDKQGYMVNAAETLIRRVQEITSVDITKEAGRNIVELNTKPDLEIKNFMTNVMQDFETLLYHADKEGLLIYPFGTYPGRFTPVFNHDPAYELKSHIFGKRRWRVAGRCVGLHCHYTLPWGVFDSDTKNIKSLTYSKNKQSLVNIYNLFIAMDPALTTFAQSSPFYQGHYLGKDSRVIAYRGGEHLNYPQGLYARLPKFGHLQPYETTGSDLTHIIKRRFKEWHDLVKKSNPDYDVAAKHGSILDTTWNPVKINAHGTMEQRGMDMNMPRVVSALAMIIKYLGKAVQEQYLQVIPSDIGILEPFKLENNELFIPPHTHVRYFLQPNAAYQGMDNDDVRQYCRSLLKLAKKFIPESHHPLLAVLDEMVEQRRTVSDQIIERAKGIGIKTDSKISKSKAAHLARSIAKDLYKEIILTRQTLENLGA